MDAIGSERKSPYHGIWVFIVISIVLPLAFYSVLYPCFVNFQDNKGAYRDTIMNIHGALAFSCLAGTFFHLSCMIAGVWSEPFEVYVNRVKDFFYYLPIIKKKAFAHYLDDIKEDGMVFWIFMFLFIITLGTCVSCFFIYFERLGLL